MPAEMYHADAASDPNGATGQSLSVFDGYLRSQRPVHTDPRQQCRYYLLSKYIAKDNCSTVCPATTWYAAPSCRAGTLAKLRMEKNRKAVQ